MSERRERVSERVKEERESERENFYRTVREFRPVICNCRPAHYNSPFLAPENHSPLSHALAAFFPPSSPAYYSNTKKGCCAGLHLCSLTQARVFFLRITPFWQPTSVHISSAFQKVEPNRKKMFNLFEYFFQNCRLFRLLASFKSQWYTRRGSGTIGTTWNNYFVATTL